MYYIFHAPNWCRRIGWTQDPAIADAVAESMSDDRIGLAVEAEPITDDAVKFARHVYGDTVGDGSEQAAIDYIHGHALLCDDDTVFDDGEIVR